MGEQEKYKAMLEKLIADTESEKIQSSEELIRLLINEIKTNVSMGVTF